jgi:hypothetical protein
MPPDITPILSGYGCCRAILALRTRTAVRLVLLAAGAEQPMDDMNRIRTAMPSIVGRFVVVRLFQLNKGK